MLEPMLSGGDIADFHKQTGLRLVPTPLGRGGMGVVYHAFDENNLEFAVKMLHYQSTGKNSALSGDTMLASSEHTSGDGGVVECLCPWSVGSSSSRFRREREVMLELCHSHLVPIIDIKKFEFDDDEELECLVLPFYKNGTLANVLLHSTVPYERFVVEKLSEVCEGLEYLHEKGIVHRDVKLENIFIDDDGRALLGDFGLVRMLSDATKLTDEQEVVGTPYFFSPEQLTISNGHPEVPHPLWDVYAVGVCLFAAVYYAQEKYAFLSSKKIFPYTGKEVLDVMKNIKHNVDRQVLQLREGVAQDLKLVVARFLERNPERRVQSAKIAGRLLRRWFDGERIIPE